MSRRRLLLPFLLVALVGACSRIQFAYNQLDWVIPDYVEDYVELTEVQRSALDRRVDTLLTWHCGTQLGPYAALLRAANADVQARRMTRERLEAYWSELIDYWRALMREASPTVAYLLTSASDDQIDRLFERFAEKNQEWLDEHTAETEAELRARYRDRMIDELERWIGPLTPAQEQAVAAWSQRFMPGGLDRLALRERWQGRLRDVVEQRREGTVFAANVEALFVNPVAHRTPEDNARYAHNRGAAIDLLFIISKDLTPDQKRDLDGEVAAVTADLDALVCADAETRQSLAPAASSGLR